MKYYKCIKTLHLDMYDENGSCTEEKITINEGDIYENCEDYNERLLIANKPAIHLVRVHENIGHWIEIYPETLAEHFKETVGENNA